MKSEWMTLRAVLQAAEAPSLQQLRNAATMDKFDPWSRLHRNLVEALEALEELEERGQL